jgi:hypothetical protein
MPTNLCDGASTASLDIGQKSLPILSWKSGSDQLEHTFADRPQRHFAFDFPTIAFPLLQIRPRGGAPAIKAAYLAHDL